MDGCGEVKQYYYDMEYNRMIDEDGFIIDSMYNIIRPNDWFMFKKNKEYMLVRDICNNYVELIWPEDEED